MGPPGDRSSEGLPLPGSHSLPDRSADLGGAAVAFREVGVHEIKEILRLWLRGEGFRSVARLARVDRKTVRRYVAAAVACGLDLAGGEGSSAMSCSAPWPSGCARTGPMGTGRAGRCLRRIMTGSRPWWMIRA